MRAIRLIARNPQWPTDKPLTLYWAREGEPMTVTFSAETVKTYLENRYQLAFETVDI